MLLVFRPNGGPRVSYANYDRFHSVKVGLIEIISSERRSSLQITNENTKVLLKLIAAMVSFCDTLCIFALARYVRIRLSLILAAISHQQNDFFSTPQYLDQVCLNNPSLRD